MNSKESTQECPLAQRHPRCPEHAQSTRHPRARDPTACSLLQTLLRMQLPPSHHPVGVEIPARPAWQMLTHPCVLGWQSLQRAPSFDAHIAYPPGAAPSRGLLLHPEGPQGAVLRFKPAGRVSEEEECMSDRLRSQHGAGTL